MNELEELRDFCVAHGLPWTERAEERFTTYVQLLEKFNAKMNLIGPFGRQQIVCQLLVDSVAPAVLSTPSGHVLDIGTGAGLPGIPLAILYPDVPMTLVEPRRKRATFLRIATNRLALEQLAIINARIEDTDLDPHDWLISKAFRTPPEWLAVAAGQLAEGGQVVCLHAADAIDDLRAAASGLGLREVAHIDDVATELDAPVPAGRAITVSISDR